MFTPHLVGMLRARLPPGRGQGNTRNRGAGRAGYGFDVVAARVIDSLGVAAYRNDPEPLPGPLEIGPSAYAILITRDLSRMQRYPSLRSLVTTANTLTGGARGSAMRTTRNQVRPSSARRDRAITVLLPQVSIASIRGVSMKTKYAGVGVGA